MPTDLRPHVDASGPDLASYQSRSVAIPGRQLPHPLPDAKSGRQGDSRRTRTGRVQLRLRPDCDLGIAREDLLQPSSRRVLRHVRGLVLDYFEASAGVGAFLGAKWQAQRNAEAG